MSVIILHDMLLDLRVVTGNLASVFENREGWQRIYRDLLAMGRTPGRTV